MQLKTQTLKNWKIREVNTDFQSLLEHQEKINQKNQNKTQNQNNKLKALDSSRNPVFFFELRNSWVVLLGFFLFLASLHRTPAFLHCSHTAVTRVLDACLHWMCSICSCKCGWVSSARREAWFAFSCFSRCLDSCPSVQSSTVEPWADTRLPLQSQR